jgi:plastocyanin
MSAFARSAPRLLPLLLLVAACSKDEATSPSSAAVPARVEVQAPELPAEEGLAQPSQPARIQGLVLYEGTPPARAPLAFGNVQGCNQPPGTIPLSESLLVEDGRIANCILWIAKGLPRSYQPPPAPEEPLAFDQQGCIYVPHVAAVRTGQKVLFENSDPTSHNVRVTSRHQSMNRTQPAGGAPIEMRFEREEPPVRIACDIHPWMRAWLGVFGHPFFAVTGADGSFAIEALPPGEYELHCWHETLGTRKASLRLPSGGSAQVEFRYSK